MDWYSFVWEWFLGQVEQNEKDPVKDLGISDRKLLIHNSKKWFSIYKMDSSGLEQGPWIGACEQSTKF